MLTAMTAWAVNSQIRKKFIPEPVIHAVVNFQRQSLPFTPLATILSGIELLVATL